jgi:hypothetical protein
MTSEEIEALQMGDIIQFPDGKYAEVRSTNNVEKNINLRMLSGDTSIAVGELPPELVNVETTCICPWADLSAAEFISNAAPLAKGQASTPLIGVLDLEKFRPAEVFMRPRYIDPATVAEPMPAAFTPMPLVADGEVHPPGTVLQVPLGTPLPESVGPPPIPPP